MKLPSVLLVEDDVAMAELVARFLEREGFRVETVHRGDAAPELARALRPDVVILDLMLPGLDGFGVCKELRRFFLGPILMLTARGDDIDQVLGLELGADDYVVKPVEPRVLVARLRALLRRPALDGKRDLMHGTLRIALDERQAYVGTQPLSLTTAEFDLLEYLAKRAGQVVDREALYRDLRGIEYDGVDRSIDLRVSRVRLTLRKADPALEPIQTVHGRGYLFRASR